MNNKILLSIITPTLNNEKQIKFFLESLKKQKKKRYKLEILIVDGGSFDKTTLIAKKYKCRIIDNPFVLADPGVNLGIKKANGELLMILATDNILRESDSLEKMVSVFDNKDITAAFPIQKSISTDSIYTKYINNFTDPFNHFIYGYSANGRTFNKVYDVIESNSVYDVYDYLSSKNRPLIAVAQGFTVRRGFTRNRRDSFDDVLPVIELVRKNKKIAFVHSVKLYHHTVRDLRHFMNKQMWATINALQKKKYGIAHRRSYLSADQKNKIKLWPFYALTVFPTIIYAFYHLIKDRDKLWILHPFLCIISAYTSLAGTIIFILNKNAEYKRK